MDPIFKEDIRVRLPAVSNKLSGVKSDVKALRPDTPKLLLITTELIDSCIETTVKPEKQDLFPGRVGPASHEQQTTQ